MQDWHNGPLTCRGQHCSYVDRIGAKYPRRVIRANVRSFRPENIGAYHEPQQQDTQSRFQFLLQYGPSRTRYTSTPPTNYGLTALYLFHDSLHLPDNIYFTYNVLASAYGAFTIHDRHDHSSEPLFLSTSALYHTVLQGVHELPGIYQHGRVVCASVEHVADGRR